MVAFPIHYQCLHFLSMVLQPYQSLWASEFALVCRHLDLPYFAPDLVTGVKFHVFHHHTVTALQLRGPRFEKISSFFRLETFLEVRACPSAELEHDHLFQIPKWIKSL